VKTNKLLEQHIKTLSDSKTAGLSTNFIFVPGMSYIYTNNRATELWWFNGSDGMAIEIILDNRELPDNGERMARILQYCPHYVLFKLNKTKLKPLEELEENVVPVKLIEATFQVHLNKKTKQIQRTQFPLIPNFAITNYKSQGQTLNTAIVDLAKPPKGN
jgi:ATP-dependent exoDNAse (exonuclease V) alpha subunit